MSTWVKVEGQGLESYRTYLFTNVGRVHGNRDETEEGLWQVEEH